jgi:hypothetical protein
MVVDIPSHLPTGSYELRAIGDDTLVATVAVTAAAGTGAPSESIPSTPSGAVAPPDSGIPVRVVVMLALAALTVAASLVVAWRAERVARLLRRAAEHGSDATDDAGRSGQAAQRPGPRRPPSQDTLSEGSPAAHATQRSCVHDINPIGD